MHLGWPSHLEGRKFNFAYNVTSVLLTAVDFEETLISSDIINQLRSDGILEQQVVEQEYEYGETLLHWVAVKNEVEIAQRLIDKGAKIDKKNHSGKTPLHWAARYNSTEVAKLLIQHGAKIDEEDEDGKTPLHWSTIRGDNIDVAELLIGQGADVNRKDEATDRTPLHLAAIYNSKKIATLLITHHAEPTQEDRLGQTPLHLAARYCSEDIAKLLIENGHFIDEKDDNRETPLCLAAESDCAEVATLLIRHGARVDGEHHWGGRSGPLFCAAHANSYSVARLLIHHGADIHKTEKGYGEGYTALARAAINNSKEVAELLIEHGAQVNDLELGSIPLYFAAQHGSKEVAELLVKHGANINQPTKDSTPLNAAIRTYVSDLSLSGQSEKYRGTVEVLIAGGADINQPGKEGETPLHVAIHLGMSAEGLKFLEYLIEKGAKVNQENIWGELPLHIATFLFQKEAIKLLINRGSDINKQDTNGDTPLHRAINRSHPNTNVKEVIGLLISSGADLNRQNKRGKSPLHCIKRDDNSSFFEPILQLFVDGGANLHLEDGEGETILYYVVRAHYFSSSLKMIGLLLEHGALDRQHKNNNGQTVLDVAEQIRDKSIQEKKWISAQSADAVCSSIGKWIKSRTVLTLMRILYQPTKTDGGFNLFTELPDELQLMIFRFIVGGELSLDIFNEAEYFLAASNIIEKSPLCINDEEIKLSEDLGNDSLKMVSYDQIQLEESAVFLNQSPSNEKKDQIDLILDMAQQINDNSEVESSSSSRQYSASFFRTTTLQKDDKKRKQKVVEHESTTNIDKRRKIGENTESSLSDDDKNVGVDPIDWTENSLYNLNFG